MANVIKIKRSTVPGKVPLAGDLEVGELAVNTADGALYTKHTSNAIVQISANLATVTLDYAVSNGNVTAKPITFSNTTVSTSSTTGAIVITGGVGIGGNLHVGQTIYVSGDILPSANNVSNIGSPANRFNTLFVSANTIDIGGAQITSVQNAIKLSSGAGNITFDTNIVSLLSNVTSFVGATGSTSTKFTVPGTVYADNFFYAANGNPVGSSTSSTESKNIFNGNASINAEATLIDSVSAQGNSSIRWTLTASNAVNATHKFAIIDSINNGANVSYNEYGVLLTNNDYQVAEYTVDVSSGNVRLFGTGDSSSIAVSFQRMNLGSSTVSGGATVENLTTAKGYTGSQGFTGSSGAGYTGSSGTNGFTGSAGTNGFTGSSGTNGFTGSSGTNGFTGSTGSLGYTGSAGTGGASTPAAVSDQTNTSTGFFMVPTGTTEQRPVNPTNGYIRYNTTIGTGEIYNSTVGQWLQFGISPAVNVEYLAVGGGGGAGGGVAGANYGAGGAAGVARTGISTSIAVNTTYTVTIGGGGAGVFGQATGGNGSSSIFASITATGGNGAGTGPAGANNADYSGAPNGGGVAFGAGGGAGAGGNGINTNGGVGVSNSISGSATFYGGGGGGGSTGVGGEGGGGGYKGGNGTTNRGGGGGGADANSTGGTGGSGIVILKYLNTYTATFSAGLTVSTTSANGYKTSTITAGTGTVTFTIA